MSDPGKSLCFGDRVRTFLQVKLGESGTDRPAGNKDDLVAKTLQLRHRAGDFKESGFLEHNPVVTGEDPGPDFDDNTVGMDCFFDRPFLARLSLFLVLWIDNSMDWVNGGSMRRIELMSSDLS